VVLEARPICAWCEKALGNVRRDAITCSKRCRQARHRFGAEASRRTYATLPMRWAYADPPYPGLAARYYEAHPDYAGEVDHVALLSRLQEFDGWALSTSSRALPVVLVDARRLRPDVRVAAWFRGARNVAAFRPLQAWEPVVYAGERRHNITRSDALVHVARARTSDPRRVIGAKPASFCYWLFDLMGALPGDSFADLFPGSGGVSRAWDVYVSRAAGRDASPAAGRDASPPAQGDG
jgi:hypothetical protein